MAARDNTIPVTFELPDGDTVELITWDFVLKKLDEDDLTWEQIDSLE